MNGEEVMFNKVVAGNNPDKELNNNYLFRVFLHDVLGILYPLKKRLIENPEVLSSLTNGFKEIDDFIEKNKIDAQNNMCNRTSIRIAIKDFKVIYSSMLIDFELLSETLPGNLKRQFERVFNVLNQRVEDVEGSFFEKPIINESTNFTQEDAVITGQP